MIQIPSTDRQIAISRGSDLTGNLFKTRNLSFDEPGYIELSHSPRATMNEDLDADWDRVAVTVYNADIAKYFVETWSEPFTVEPDVLANAATQVADADHPNGDARSDATWFDNKLAVTESNDVHYYDAATNAWVDTNISLATTTGGQHPIVNFLSKSALAVCNVNTVKLYSALSATPTLLETLTINADFAITSAKYLNGNLYVGTRHLNGGKAALYVWNGEGTGAQGVWEADGHIIHDIEVFRDAIVAFTSSGALLEFTGSGFGFLAGFPIYYTERVTTDEDNINIYHNSLKANGDVLYVAFSDSVNEAYRTMNQPAGVWCYDPAVGLYHRYSFSAALTYKAADPAIDTATDQVTVAQAIPTGTEVWYKASTANAALASGTRYYAIYVDATHVRIATTRANAASNTYVNFTADDGVGERWTFFPNIDFGQVFAGRNSALCTIDFSTQAPQYGVDVIWAADLGMRDDPAETNSHLGSVSTGVEARGDFETPKALSLDVTSTFNRLTLRFLPLADEADAIVVKYRTEDDRRDTFNISTNTAWRIAWTSSTTFTTTVADWSEAKTAFDAGKAWEVNVLIGAGAGILAHISAISESGGTYTVTIDEPYANYASGDIAVAVFRNWLKLRAIAYGDDEADEGFYSANLDGVSGTFIQAKVELRGVGAKVIDLRVDDRSLLPARSSAAAALV